MHGPESRSGPEEQYIRGSAIECMRPGWNSEREILGLC